MEKKTFELPVVKVISFEAKDVIATSASEGGEVTPGPDGPGHGPHPWGPFGPWGPWGPHRPGHGPNPFSGAW